MDICDDVHSSHRCRFGMNMNTLWMEELMLGNGQGKTLGTD